MNSYYFIKIIRACLNLVQSATSVKFNFVLCLPVGRQVKTLADEKALSALFTQSSIVRKVVLNKTKF